MSHPRSTARFMVLVQRGGATMSPAMNVSREHAWEVARRERLDGIARVSIVEVVESDAHAEPVCVLDWDEALD